MNRTRTKGRYGALLLVLIGALFLILTSPLAVGKIRETGWPDPVANHVVPYEKSGLTHGPMLGRPTANSMRVWVRTDGRRRFKVVYGTALPLSADMEGVSGETSADRDNTGFVDLKGLARNTRYYYGIVIDGRLVDTRMDFKPGFPSFRTLPDTSSHRDPKYNPKGLFNFSFATSFGNRQTHASLGKYENAPGYSTMLREHGENLRFFIMNGDYIYEEHRTRENRPHRVEHFRADYKYYLEHGPDMAKFFRHVPVLFTYDDHETYSDLEGTGEIGLKRGKWLYRDLALRPYYEYAGWANFDGPQYQPIRWGAATVNKGEALLFDPRADFTSLRREAISNIHVAMGQKNTGVYGLEEIVDRNRLRVTPAFTHDEQCTYSIGTHHYYDWKVGNCHFLALDMRGERTRYIPEKAHDPDRFLLGEAQKQWLTNKIMHTDADFIFIVSSVPWMVYHTNFHVKGAKPVAGGRSAKEDGFTGAVRERDEVLAFLDKIEKPVLILTGDLHNAFVIQVTDNVWEFMLGPINSFNHPIATAGDPPYGGWFDSEGKRVKIKWVSGFPNELDYTRLRSKYYGVIQVNNVMKSGRQNEPGYHWIAYDEPQVVVRVHDAYTGELVYAEGISTVDAKPVPDQAVGRTRKGRLDAQD